MNAADDLAIRRALEVAGVEFHRRQWWGGRGTTKEVRLDFISAFGVGGTVEGADEGPFRRCCRRVPLRRGNYLASTEKKQRAALTEL